MTSAEMKRYGEETSQPEFVTHAECLAGCERLDKLGDEMMAISDAIAGKAHVPADLQERVRRVAMYLMTGCWAYGDFPEDGIFAEADRVKRELSSPQPFLSQSSLG
jgi:hypothetical protein